MLNCNLFLYFQHHYSSHMIFRNHNNNMLNYDQETFLIIINVENINIYVETVMHFILMIHRWIESSKEQHLFDIIFC